MTDHEQFEILCVCAATGDISDKEVQELRFHLAECRDCQRRLAEYGQMSAQFLPMFGDRHTPVLPPEGMSERFAETARRHAIMLRTPSAGSGLLGRLGPSTPRIAATVAVLCLLATFLVVHSHRHDGIQTVAITEVVHTPTPAEKLGEAAPVKLVPAAPALHSPSDTATIQRLEEQLAKLRDDDQAVAAERDQLQTKVATLSANLASTQQGAAQSLQEADAVRQQLERKHQLEIQDLAVLAQNHDQLTQLQNDLAQRTEDVKHYRAMLSSSDQARDLIVARNLHIIDVHDVNGAGDHQLPFGRIFYTEGKSLVFYAYDLPRASDTNPQLSFQVWGGEQGKEEVAKSLGVFRSESDGRWILTCDDAHVLARVDTIFVTTEKGRRSAQKPSGKRILYAFLGDRPNHP
jgi:hypothetical protein